jgi:hypothetical protein
VKRHTPTLLLTSMLLALAPIGWARADSQQAPEGGAATCAWRKALVPQDREIEIQATTAAVEFTVADGCTVELSLVSYEASAPVFDPAVADQQKLFAARTDVYGPGEHRAEVALPACYWQVDFVAGKPIQDLSPTDLYGSRRIAGRSGGEACVGGATTTTSTTAPPPTSTTEATTTTAVLGATSTSTPGRLLAVTGARSAPLLLAGLGLVLGGLVLLLATRGHGRTTS